jgi:hypothetical protein
MYLCKTKGEHMSPVQRVLNIYKANSEFSNQNGSNLTSGSFSSKKTQSANSKANSKNSFEKILTDKIKKYDSQHS